MYTRAVERFIDVKKTDQTLANEPVYNSSVTNTLHAKPFLKKTQ